MGILDTCRYFRSAAFRGSCTGPKGRAYACRPCFYLPLRHACACALNSGAEPRRPLTFLGPMWRPRHAIRVSNHASEAMWRIATGGMGFWRDVRACRVPRILEHPAA